MYLDYNKDEKGSPIGIFDSGFGGLTILSDIRRTLPQYDYLYLGDNARAPYGSHAFDTIKRYTREAVHYLFEQGCPLVILACNTASARALRSIQQKDLPISTDPTRRVLGVIRPTVECLADYSLNNHVGLVGTQGTVASDSYALETAHLHPHITFTQHACPMWVPLVENGELSATPGTKYFIERELKTLLQKDPLIDTILLGCTHYPLLLDRIKEALPPSVRVVSQGPIVADSLRDYLSRHPEMDDRLTRKGTIRYHTTTEPEDFALNTKFFLNRPVDVHDVTKVDLLPVSKL